MKLILLSTFTFIFFSASSQNTSINSLPTGKYETYVKQSQNKWSSGDIVLIDQNHYKVSSINEVGEYRFSASAQRIFFVTGPLKTVFAKTLLDNEKPAIFLPVLENEQQGLKLIPADIVGYLR